MFDSKYEGVYADGVFTIPDNGKYELRFKGQSAEQNTVVLLRLNGEKILARSSYVVSARQEMGGSIKLSPIANLKKGDKIEVILEEGELEMYSNLSATKLK